MKFPVKTLTLTLGLLAKENTSVNAEKEKEKDIRKAVMAEIVELKSSGEWPKGASASTIAYLTKVGQWPLKTSESTTVARSGTTPANDSCSTATHISSLPFKDSGDTTHASTETGIGTCGTSYQNAPAVWYKVTGTGEKMSAETVDPYGYDTKLHVYSGSCGDFTCIDGNHCKQFLNCLSKVTWDSVAGEEYFIMVHGFVGDFGEYKLEVISGICAELDGRCMLECEDNEYFVCVPGLCSYDRNLEKVTKSPKKMESTKSYSTKSEKKTRELKEEEVDVVDIQVSAEGSVERKLKASKAPKATKSPWSSCECSVPRRRGCDDVDDDDVDDDDCTIM